MLGHLIAEVARQKVGGLVASWDVEYRIPGIQTDLLLRTVAQASERMPGHQRVEPPAREGMVGWGAVNGPLAS